MTSYIRHSLLLLLLIISRTGFSQQVPLYNQYYINPFVLNPSLSGHDDKINAYFLRNQKYLGFDGGNVTNILTVDGKVFTDKIGLGLTIFNDQMGPAISQGAGLSFSYKVNFQEDVALGFGMSGGVTDRRFDPSNLVVKDWNDPTIQYVFPSRKTYFDLTAGLYFDYKKFQVGVSAPQLLANDIKLAIDGSHILSRHYFMHMKYDWMVSEPLNLSIIPFAKVMYVSGAPLQYDINVSADFKNIGWVTATYRSNYSVGANLGVRIKKNLMLGYSYNFVMNNTNAYGPVNQEILFGYSFGTKSNDKEKKLLEEALKENERLKMELQKKQNENDSLAREKARSEEELNEKLRKQEEYYNDTVNKLNEEIRKLREQKKTVEEVKTTNTTDDKLIRRTDNDHFVELDKTTESPKGYYVIDGAFGQLSNAEEHFNEIKANFPEARIIFNERNQLHYILLTYSTEKTKVFDTHRKSRGLGLEKSWILEYR